MATVTLWPSPIDFGPLASPVHLPLLLGMRELLVFIMLLGPVCYGAELVQAWVVGVTVRKDVAEGWGGRGL